MSQSGETPHPSAASALEQVLPSVSPPEANKHTSYTLTRDETLQELKRFNHFTEVNGEFFLSSTPFKHKKLETQPK